MSPSPTRLSLLFISLVIFSASLHARIGESRSTVERRVTSDNRGIIIDDEDLMRHYLNQAKFKNALMGMNDRGEMAVHENLDLTVGVYYKVVGDDRAFESQLIQKSGRHAGQPVNNPAGWLYFVVYHKGKSVLEAYRHIGGITEAEVNGLLARNQESSNWARGKLPEDQYPDKDYKPFLPQNFYRADGKVLANQDGDTLTVFMLEVDRHLSKTKQERESEDAPDSLAGF
ncbi:hypothetical protein [Cerasicoccus maritimus]|uniref:hypothetical protein n=1 Tax=Cerasicoccus maritimus TaxID=490089 RepID=UPI00285276AA|nr:hypothetical protein [Cerasicoccus maritimus]